MILDQAERAAALLQVTPGWSKLGIDDATLRAVLNEASKLAEGEIAPLNKIADREGCQFQNQKVITPKGYQKAYRAFTDGGWIGFDLAEKFGGQGLPLVLQTACQPIFDGACPAFMMAPGATRAAAHLFAQTAPDLVAGLLDGTGTATICISEPGAGSDVGRITTKATRDGENWRISGQKIWISFGGHDLSKNITHCLLARSNDTAGTRGLSLFAVLGDNVETIRIEDKMGLHGSPTCALSFENVPARLLSVEGRGLPQLFTMIQLMRLQTGCQGLGIASAALSVAQKYAGERRQGGAPDQPPVAIIQHIDVKRQLMEMTADVEILRAATLELAMAIDQNDDPAFIGWLLPLIKTFGGETGINTASRAIQVLGGAGYTKEFPLEQALRDARVLTIYEGTTGMQAQDFLMRRLWRDNGAGLKSFLARAESELADHHIATAVLERFKTLSNQMEALKSNPTQGLLAADSYARAGWLALSAWLCCRLDKTGLSDVAAYRWHRMEEEMALFSKQCHQPLTSFETP